MNPVFSPLLLAVSMLPAVASEPAIQIVPISLTVTNQETSHSFDQKKGTTIGIAYETGENCKILNHTLPKNTNLTLKDSSGKNLGKVDVRSFSSDGVFEFGTDQLPAPGSKSLKLSGTIEIEALTDKATSPPTPLTIKKGETFDILGLSFKIIRVSGERFTLRMTTNEKIQSLNIIFYDTKGVEIDLLPSNFSEWQEDGSYGISRTYTRDKKEEKTNIGVSFWKGTQLITVPVNVTLNLSEASANAQDNKSTPVK